MRKLLHNRFIKSSASGVVLMLAILLGAARLYAQTPATLPYEDNFDTGAENWQLLNDDTTKCFWYIGATSSGGSGVLIPATDTPVLAIVSFNPNNNTYRYPSGAPWGGPLADTIISFAYRDVTFPATLNDFVFRFVYKMTGYANDTQIYASFHVWITPDDFTPIAGEQITPAPDRIDLFGPIFDTTLAHAQWLVNEFNWDDSASVIPNSFAGTTGRLVFEFISIPRSTANGTPGFPYMPLIDSLQVMERICELPLSLSFSAITDSSAVTAWQDSNIIAPNAYQYYYSTNATAPDALTNPSGTTTDTTVALSELDGSTTYYFWVRTQCNDTLFSEWTAIDSFTTPAAPCLVPGAITVGTVTDISAQLSWGSTTNNATNAYEYYYNTSGVAPTDATVATGSTVDTFVSLDGLSAYTAYYVWVRSACADNAVSDWTAMATFTTLCGIPSQATAGDITDHSAVVSWTGAGAEYVLEYGPAGFTPGSGANSVTVNGLSTTVDNLDPNTAYDFYVRSVCEAGSDTSGWNTVTGITTLCDTVLVSLGDDYAICPGDTVTLSVANEGSTYTWSNGDTDSTTQVTGGDSYAVEVTDAYGCTGSDTIAIGLLSLPEASGITVTDNGAGNYSFAAEDTAAINQYHWDFGDESAASNAMQPEHQYAGSGTYTITLIITNDCGSDTLTTTISYTAVGVSDIGDGSGLAVYPNPAKNRITIRNNSNVKIIQVDLVNIVGQSIRSLAVNNSHTIAWNTEGLAAGVYYFQIQTDKGMIVKRFNIVR